MIDTAYTMKRVIYCREHNLRFEQSTYVPSLGELQWPSTVRIYFDDGDVRKIVDTTSMEPGGDFEAYVQSYLADRTTTE